MQAVGASTVSTAKASMKAKPLEGNMEPFVESMCRLFRPNATNQARAAVSSIGADFTDKLTPVLIIHNSNRVSKNMATLQA